MAQLINVRLTRPENCPLGFRLHGGKDFGTPLVIQKVNGGSPAEKAGLLAGDSVVKVNTTDVYNLRHKEAQDVIVHAGQNFDLTIQRGGGTWKPTVTPTGALPSPNARSFASSLSPVTQTSLKASPQPVQHIGSGYNSAAKPFNYMNGNGDTVKSIVNKQYNTPVGIYSEETIAETLSAQAEVLAGGVLGVNFKKNEKTYEKEKSEVFKMLQEAGNEPEPEVSPHSPPGGAVTGLRHVSAPVTRPDAPVNNTGGLPPGQNICEECERLIIGVFVRIKDKNLHVECFKCATCGSSLKNQGYYNLNGKLYCDIHAKMVARQNPPAPNLEPVTVTPNNMMPASTITSALSSHTVPLPPLSNPLPPLSGNGLAPFSQSTLSCLSEDQTDNSLSLKSENVEAFATILSNGEKNFSSVCTNPPKLPINNNMSEKNEKPHSINGFDSCVDSLKSMNGKNDMDSNHINPSMNFNTLTAPNSVYKKVIPPHLGGNYKPSSNMSGPKPFGAPISPVAPPSTSSLSPRSMPSIPSAPISPASTLQRPLQQGPVSQPLPDEHNTSPQTNAKWIADLPAKDKNTIMRQIAKMAFDGNYEIGIQRKIKPGDHIATMASKIKDTVVMKHPLNTANLTNSTIEASKNPKGDNRLHAESPYQNGNSVKKLENNMGQLAINHNGGIPPPPPPPPKFNSPINNKFNGNAYSSPSLSQSSSPLTSLSGSGSLSPANEKQSVNETYSNIPSRQITSALLNKMLLKDLMNKDKIDTEKDNTKKDKIESRTINHLLNHQNMNIQNSLNDKFANVKPINGKLDTGKENLKNESHTINSTTGVSETIKKIENDQFDYPVTLREKKQNITEDKNCSKRDSKIITGPLNSVASVNLVDGIYPICNQCNKEITRGPFITALGRIWCPEHFVCVNNTCKRQLQDIGFVEENGQLYCEYCFEQFIAPPCDKCHGKIKGDCLNAIGKHFHPECFSCAYCGKLFGNNPFFLEEGLPYCEADWNELFTTKCFACGFPVEAGDRWVEALNNNYHSQCFNCTMCKKNLEGQSFYAKGGRPFCKNHAR